MTLWTSDAKRDEINEKNPLDPGWCELHARNWSIYGPQFDVEAVQKKLGGGELVCA